jgi:hypothetical protein
MEEPHAWRMGLRQLPVHDLTVGGILMEDRHFYRNLILVVILLIIVIFGGIYWAVVYMGENGCQRKEEAYGRDTRYDFFAGGCFVELDDGTWIETEKYRNHEEDQ